MSFYRFARAIVRVVARICMPYKVHNRASFPEEGPVVLCANHLSFTDPVFLGLSIKRQLYFIAKQQVCEAPVIGWIVRKLGAFPVDRDGNDLRAVRACLNVLKNSNILGIFPEGTRILDDKISEPKAGVALIAKKANAPIVMVHIRPKKGRFKLFCTTDLFFSDPISYEQLCGDMDFQAASEKIMHTIYALGE